MIKVDNLTFAYQTGKNILKDVSFHLEDSKWLSIIGHNGSGKSTLAKALVGLLENYKGTIEVEGILLTNKTIPDIRKKIGIVFQNPDNQFVGVTVKHDIAFGLENQMIPRDIMLEKIDYYSKIVGMNEFLDREPSALSGGQKQRVALASALAMEQSIIIFDEATSMLDPKGTSEIKTLIKALNRQNHKTIITITHDLEFAKESDRIIVLNEGEVVLDGAPNEVYKEKEILLKAGLILPYINSVYEDIRNVEMNEKLKETVCRLVSKM